MGSALHHLDLNVTGMKRSHAFYDRVLSHIGYRPVDYSAPDEAEGLIGWHPVRAIVFRSVFTRLAAAHVTIDTARASIILR